VIYKADRFSYLVTDEIDCPKCGDPFEIGDEVIEVRADHYHPKARESIHMRCFDSTEEAVY